jgi:hypothetical protein
MAEKYFCDRCGAEAHSKKDLSKIQVEDFRGSEPRKELRVFEFCIFCLADVTKELEKKIPDDGTI